MPTVSDFSKAFEVTPNTIRRWSEEFSAFLEPGANPPAGKPRSFTLEDAMVISLVGELRASNVSYEEIHQALSAGERRPWPPTPHEWPPDRETTALAPLELMERAVAGFQAKIEALEENQGYLRRELDKERQARIDAERKAALLEGRLQEMSKEEPAEGVQLGATEADNEGNRAPWWRFWRR